MEVAVWLVVLVVVVVSVSTVAGRADLPAPVLLVGVGAVACFVPWVPDVRLTAELVLVGLLPPLLYNAALQTSLVDFNAHRRAILSLSIGLVVFTTLGVGVLVRLVVPDVGWPAAFALGAVVAPPDAVAATAIARRIGLPRAIVTVLEGESLLNDATALVALRTAILAAAGSVSVFGVAGDFVLAAVGGVACGVLVYLLVARVRSYVTDPVIDTSVSIITPFTAYVAAEEIHASGVLAVVVAGLLLGHRAPVLQTSSSRIAERLNWRTFSFLLENAVFLLIGLQTRWIVDQVSSSAVPLRTIVAACLAVLGGVVVLRMAWMLPSWFLVGRAGTGRAPASYAVVVGWAGMRGVVTLAAAFAIPAETVHREVLLLVALVVTAGTLVVQGLSLPWLVRALRVPAPDPRADDLARAELLQQATQAGLARLAEAEDDLDPAVRDLLRSRVEQRDFAAWERLGPVRSDGETPSETYARVRLAMLKAERARVLELRSAGGAPHEVVADVLAMLDVEESMVESRAEGGGRGAAARTEGALMSRAVDGCVHLRDAADLPDPDDRVCVDCVQEGTTWVHLRLCLACGHVGCCDSSPRRHASAHFRSSGHPVVRSAEPDERWRWCYADELLG